MRIVSALALTLTGGVLPLAAVAPALEPARLAGLKAQQPQRTAQAQAHLLQLRSQLGLNEAAGFIPRQVSTNPEGRTVVRLQQTHHGLRVWGGSAIAHVEADGQVKALTQSVKTEVTLPSLAPSLTAEKAKAIALNNLAPKGPLAGAPTVEPVVFPTRYTGGMATRIDPAEGRAVWDREMSIAPRRPSDGYVLAYEVRTYLRNTKDGHREIAYIIDAATGSILRKWSELQGDSPATGTGRSFYRGDVPLGTSKADDGTYALWSQDRGSIVNPIFAQSGLSTTGLTTCYASIDLNFGMIGFNVYQGLNTTDSWGNGAIMPFPYDFTYVDDGSQWWGATRLDFSSDGSTAWLQGALTPAGETEAVDCHWGLSTTWDFYKNVFHRNGIDDLGTSTFGVVHDISYGPSSIYPAYDNAFWSPANFGMFFGTGTFGTPLAAQSYGMKAVTELDITGHELTHGVTWSTAKLLYLGQSGGLNEATSDIFGKMVQAYAEGGNSGSKIPDFPAGDLTKWEVARNCMPAGVAPLRFMYKPSLDGASADGWYDGIDQIDVHFSSGPVNRFYYFLVNGSSSSPSSATYSPYYPAGMAGIGNDKAARIMYKALTEYFTEDTDFESARAGTISAAQDLFDAWSAVNVGLAPGQAPRVKVSFPVINGAGSFLDDYVQVPSTHALEKVQIFPTSTRVRIACNVENTTNPALTFTVPTWQSIQAPAGTIQADGTWTTPNWNYYAGEDLLSVWAISQADPSQFASSQVLVVNLDSDLDDETDAIDLGSTAMSWYDWTDANAGFQTPLPASRIMGGGDWDLVFFTQAFQNGFPVK
jgi:Zn-dependent metalloprotease